MTEPQIPDQLLPCPNSPNCVSTTAEDKKQHMPPIPYSGSLEEARKRLLTVLAGLNRGKLVVEEERYLKCEFKTSFFGFVDDVEFLFDEENKLIHFRSASRVGYSDLGVNRKRMKKITEAFLTKDEP